MFVLCNAAIQPVGHLSVRKTVALFNPYQSKATILVSFTNLTQTNYSLLEEGVTGEELTPWDWLVGKSVGIPLIRD